MTHLVLAMALTIDAAISNGVSFLLSQQNPDGFWSDKQMPALTALPLWALSTVKGNDDVRLKAAKFIHSTQRPDGGFYVPKPGRGGSGLGNYNTSVCLTALYESGYGNVKSMLAAREYIASSQLVGDDSMAGGFGYDKLSRRRYADLSNTSYALSAMARTRSLEELRVDGKKADVNWEKALSFVENLLEKEGVQKGGAKYNHTTTHAGSVTNSSGKVSLKAYGAMTYAAVLSMCSAKLDKADPRVRLALEYMENNWSVDENPGMGSQGLYYFYDIMARALSAAGVEKVGNHEWKKELSDKIISLQKKDGSWYNDNNRFWESDPVLCTSFALIALSLCK
jgi:squalene-hopene/tetraprenyl-beta-curcumene cyclase